MMGSVVRQMRINSPREFKSLLRFSRWNTQLQKGPLTTDYLQNEGFRPFFPTGSQEGFEVAM